TGPHLGLGVLHPPGPKRPPVYRRYGAGPGYHHLGTSRWHPGRLSGFLATAAGLGGYGFASGPWPAARFLASAAADVFGASACAFGSSSRRFAETRQGRGRRATS